MTSYEADDAHLAAYYYDQLLASVCDLLAGNHYGEQVYDALIRNAVELAEMYELGDAREARRKLICLIDKYIAARRTLAAHRRLRAERYTGREERKKREAQMKMAAEPCGRSKRPVDLGADRETQKSVTRQPCWVNAMRRPRHNGQSGQRRYKCVR